jgi:hypothetical protein
VLQTRASLKGDVKAALEEWQSFAHTFPTFEGVLKELDGAASKLAAYDSRRQKLHTAVEAFCNRQLNGLITDLIERLRRVSARMDRSTVNIAVWGERRIGKSTLLGSISGLPETVIPRRSGREVTAVRSSILHAEARQQAVLTFHSWESFRDTVLRAYHSALQLGEPPETMEDFRRYSYPDPDQDTGDRQLGQYNERQRSLARDIRSIHGALNSYKDDLTGEAKTKNLNAPQQLEELRQYITYPTWEEELAGGIGCPRKYLAVRKVQIYYNFPDGVKGLALIDLPGLGELKAGAPDQYVTDLGNEADVVLYLKRTDADRGSIIGEIDGTILSLLDQARGPVDRKDFAFFVINEDENAPRERTRDLLLSIKGRLGDDFSILRCNATNKESVRSHVVKPVLDHLRQRLSQMDRAVLSDVRSKMDEACRHIRMALSTLLTDLKSIEGHLPDLDTELEHRARALKDEVAETLAHLRDHYRVLQSHQDSPFVEEIHQAKAQVDEWLNADYESIRESWVETRTKRMYSRDAFMGIAEDEFNAARLRIWKALKGLEASLNTPVATLWSKVATALRHHLSIGILPERHGNDGGREALEAFQNRLQELRCGELADAVDELLRVRIDFAGHLLPSIRESLDRFHLREWPPKTATVPGAANHMDEGAQPRDASFDYFDRPIEGFENRSKTGGPGSEQDNVMEQEPQLVGGFRPHAELLFDLVVHRMHAELDLLEKKLSERTTFINQIMYAAAAQFYDSFVLPESAGREFKRLYERHRHQLWSDFAEGIHGFRERVAEVVRWGAETGEELSKASSWAGRLVTTPGVAVEQEEGEHPTRSARATARV